MTFEQKILLAEDQRERSNDPELKSLNKHYCTQYRAKKRKQKTAKQIAAAIWAMRKEKA